MLQQTPVGTLASSWPHHEDIASATLHAHEPPSMADDRNSVARRRTQGVRGLLHDHQARQTDTAHHRGERLREGSGLWRHQTDHPETSPACAREDLACQHALGKTHQVLKGKQICIPAGKAQEARKGFLLSGALGYPSTAGPNRFGSGRTPRQWDAAPYISARHELYDPPTAKSTPRANSRRTAQASRRGCGLSLCDLLLRRCLLSM